MGGSRRFACTEPIDSLSDARKLGGDATRQEHPSSGENHGWAAHLPKHRVPSLTKADYALVELFKIEYKRAFRDTKDNVRAFLHAISSTWRAEVKRPDLLDKWVRLRKRHRGKVKSTVRVEAES